MGIITHRLLTLTLKIGMLAVDVAQLAVILVEALFGHSSNSIVGRSLFEDSGIDIDKDRGCSLFGSFPDHRSSCKDHPGVVWEITIDKRFDDGRTIPRGSDDSLDGGKILPPMGGLLVKGSSLGRG